MYISNGLVRILSMALIRSSTDSLKKKKRSPTELHSPCEFCTSPDKFCSF